MHLWEIQRCTNVQNVRNIEKYMYKIFNAQYSLLHVLDIANFCIAFISAVTLVNIISLSGCDNLYNLTYINKKCKYFYHIRCVLTNQYFTLKHLVQDVRKLSFQRMCTCPSVNIRSYGKRMVGRDVRLWRVNLLWIGSLSVILRPRHFDGQTVSLLVSKVPIMFGMLRTVCRGISDQMSVN